MKTFSARAAALMLATTFSFSFAAHAQIDEEDVETNIPQMEESAPQEPPYASAPVESEFDSAEKQNAEVLSVLQNSDPKEVKKNAADDFYKPKADNEEPVRQERPTASGKSRVEKIHHPLAGKGLLRIEKDGTYVYKTRESNHDQSASFRVGLLQPPEIQGPYADFKTMYSSTDIPIIFFDYEWQPFSSFGKLGIQAGLGFFTSQGQGRFQTPDDRTGSYVAEEKYTFLAFPINLGVVYRLEWMNKQWFAPYLAGGGTYFAIAETRDDNKSPSLVGSPGVYGAAGGMFNITALDRETAFTMSSEYGISNLWVTAEFRYIKSFNEDLDFTSSVVNLGFAVDY